MRALGLLAATLAMGGVQAERLRGFDDLAARSERLQLKGIGLGQSGRFAIGGLSGRYDRFAGKARRRGDTLALAGLRFSVDTREGRLAGECREGEESFGERAAPGVRVTSIATPLHMTCRFAVDEVPAGTLAMGEIPARGVTVREDRRGSLRWDGQDALTVRSVHHFIRSGLPAGAPLGYVLEDGSGPLAGVDFSRSTPVLLLPRDDRRIAALAATVALSLRWEAEAE